jgi:hypothetical protein
MNIPICFVVLTLGHDHLAPDRIQDHLVFIGGHPLSLSAFGSIIANPMGHQPTTRVFNRSVWSVFQI